MEIAKINIRTAYVLIDISKYINKELTLKVSKKSEVNIAINKLADLNLRIFLVRLYAFTIYLPQSIVM
jgi:hypothetical protein